MNLNNLRELANTVDPQELEKHVSRAFSTDSGKIVLAFLVEEHVMNSAFKTDANETAYLLGKQDLVKSILDVLTDKD